MTPLPSRYQNLDRARRVHGDRVERVGAYLWKTDPLADAAVSALAAHPRREGNALVQVALERGSAALDPSAPRALRALVEAAEDVPAWVDWAACDRGGALLMRSGALGGAVLGARSLVLGYASPAGNKPLVLSGRLTEQATRRLDETSRFVQAVSRPGGMRPYADGWRITLKVRLIHAQVRRMILATGRWDAAALGAPINQHDMAATTLLFGVILVDGLRKLGMDVLPEQAESYAHLWRWVGRVIGVDDGILPASETDGTKLADLVATTMGPPDDDSRALTKALFDAAFERARTPAEVEAARRRVAFGHLLCRELVGDAMADQLEVPRLAYRHAALPVLRRIVRSTSALSRRVPFAERRAERAGARYWDHVVEVGLAHATYDFSMPDRLARGERA